MCRVAACQQGWIEAWHGDACGVEIVQRSQQPGEILFRRQQRQVHGFAKLRRAVEHAGLTAVRILDFSKSTTQGMGVMRVRGPGKPEADKNVRAAKNLSCARLLPIALKPVPHQVGQFAAVADGVGVVTEVAHHLDEALLGGGAGQGARGRAAE